MGKDRARDDAGLRHRRAIAAMLLIWTPASLALAEQPSGRCDELRADVAAVVFHAAYYPYPSKLRIHLDPSAMRMFETLRAAELKVRTAEQSTVLERLLPLPESGQYVDLVVDLPRLTAGLYSVGLRLVDAAGCNAAGPERVFRHEEFGWEHNDIGTETRVIPPLTPVGVGPGRVAVAGRSYRVAESGVWTQIESEREPLLAAPARFEAVVDGKRAPWRVVDPVSIGSDGPSSANARSRLAAGGLELEIVQTFEVDGLVRVGLNLSGPEDARLDRLDLVLPLRGAKARLLNAITDGARHHFLGATPGGAGVVWDSTRVGRDHLPAGFVPYVWLGDEVRGLAWLAESTRDWLVDADAPTQEIRRSADSTDLVVRFVTSPGRLGRKRHISFALQATPAKPRPAGWRRWHLTCEAFPGVFRVCPLASGWYWGAKTPFGDVFPRGRDWSLFEHFAEARRSGRRPWKDVVGPWLARHDVTDPVEVEGYRSHFAFTFNSLSRQPDRVIAYINARGSSATDEFLVYVDEWRPIPFGDRAGRDADHKGEIRIQSTRSFHDYALWHLDRMLESGAVDGFYFDNSYLRASYDDVVGPAYRDDAGNLVPGVDIFGLRDFLRRAQTLVHERRGGWFNAVHMTTTPLAPLHVWAGFSLDGEWKYGHAPYAERFPPIYLRAASLGSQSGTVPVYLHGLKASPSERPALERQLAGYMAAHEIRVLRRLEGPLKTIWSGLFDAGYGRDDCRVRRYWDPVPGFELEGVRASTLLVVCGDEVLAVVASAGPAGRAHLRLDPDALGIARVSRCMDVEGRGRVEHLSPFGCTFWLERYDTRMIRVLGVAE